MWPPDRQAKIILEVLICAIIFCVFTRCPVTEGPCIMSESCICGNEGIMLTVKRRPSQQEGSLIENNDNMVTPGLPLWR